MTTTEVAAFPANGTNELKFDETTLREVVNGQEVAKANMGALEYVISAVLNLELGIHTKVLNLGRVVSEGLFRLNPAQRTMRRPDVAFISYERWARDRKLTSAHGWDVVPELVVEVVSPTDLAVEILAKVREYLKAGVIQVWVIFPNVREVHIFEGETGCRIFGPSDSLDGGDLLPGFRLALADLFRDSADIPPTIDDSGGVGVDPE